MNSKDNKPEMKVGAIFMTPEGKKNDLLSYAPGVFGFLLRTDEGVEEEDYKKLQRALWRFGFDGGLAGHV